ncbi:hypothetical protein KFL_008220020 [Klebsormidium nitens]|uniref:BAH domain-containing protein n=1 Tax=Klebsormidium nitens TaxID=105231 RepID=A0A1Y1IQW0_KLENI|nr:hypothetical protein KFL_008220020 [Klebsormidium nitens]|eukprot:GAQ91631.1 hypothetical protein KFL_008220020 [Klebsormidium nitens]
MWADLVRHAGGHVCRSLEHDLAHAVLLEPGVDAPSELKGAAWRAKIAIKTLDWAVDALLVKGKDPEKAGEPDRVPREETLLEGGPAREGLGLREPPPLPPHALVAPGVTDAPPAKRTYFSAVTSAGEGHQIGDAADIQADGSASARVVQLMSLWEASGIGGEGCMRATCRLLMRPRETDFPFFGGRGLGANQGSAESGLQEVYLSSVVQEMDVSELRKKVHVARSTGGAGPSAGFLCRFFYDAEREILQKLEV